MDDLLLFRLLRDGCLDDERLGGLLAEAARLPAAERAAFVGWLEPARRSPSAALRAAALGCLTGLEGTGVIAAQVAALDDPDEGVRAVALEALRLLAQGQPARWVHVAFHRDVAVRRAALAGDAPEGAAAMSLALVADEACRDLALARFVPGAVGSGGRGAWPLPANGVLLLLEMLDQGLVDLATARRLLWRVSAEGLRPLLGGGRARDRGAVEAWLKQAACGAERPAPIEGEDDLDRLVALLWWPGTDGAPDERQAWRGLLGRLVPSGLFRDDGQAERMAAALLAAAPGRGELADALLDLLIEVYPAALTFAWLPRERRRAALRVYYQRGEGMKRVSRELLEALLESDLPAHAEGGLDLWALGAVLHLAQGAPYEQLLGWVSERSLVDSIFARIDEAMPFLGLDDRSSRGTAHLLDLLRRRCPERSAWLTAIWALTAPLDQLDAVGLRTTSEAEEEARGEQKKEAKKARKAGADVPPVKAPEPQPIAPAEALAILGELLAVERQGRPLGARRTERLGQVLGARLTQAGRGPQVEKQYLQGFVAVWLGDEASEPAALGVQTLVALAQPLDGDAFARQLAALDARWLHRLLPALAHCSTLPFAKERALAHALAGHPDARVRAWARERLPAEQAPAGPSLDGRPLLDAERAAIRDCHEAELGRRLAPLGLLRRGLASAMLERPAAAQPSVDVCVVLLASDDAPGEVDQALGRWGQGEPAFLRKLQEAAVQRLNASSTLPTLALAWLQLWERHAFALLDRLTADGATLAAGAAPVLAGLNTPWVRARLIEALGRVTGLLAYRDHERLRRVISADLTELFVAELTGPAGLAAAEALVFLDRSRAVAELISSVRPAAERLLPDLTAEVRERLASWIEVRGLDPGPARAARTVTLAVDLRAVARCDDLEQLIAWCEQGSLAVVEEAALRLLELGAGGQQALVRVLARGADRLRLRPILDTLDLWTDPDAAAAARSLLHADALAPEVRFALARALHGAAARGQAPASEAPAGRAPSPDDEAPPDGAPSLADEALTVAEQTALGPGNWFGLDDWAWLRDHHPAPDALAARLAGSPQPHAYRESVEHLLRLDAPGARTLVAAGLVAFLEAGTVRLQSLRRRAALRLLEGGAWQAWPVLLAARADGSADGVGVLAAGTAADVTAAARGFVMLGTGTAEQSLLAMLPQAAVEARGEALEILIDQARSDDTRRAAVKLVASFPHRAQKLDQVATTFAWGVHRARELLGTHYQVSMVDGQGLGYTRLNERRIFVSPLPILRREQHGRELVEGLILHELGHHRYHRGEAAEACWKAADQEGIQRLYNLVLDEHLERNLRALDEGFGDRLKLLTSYAFQHSTRAVPVAELLDSLGTRAAHVLPATRMRVARHPDQVVVDSGPLLSALERRGLAFARFLRALRMGLGNRHGDARVEQALALFRGGFRRQGPAALLDVARALQRLFGHETALLGCTGSHESLTDDASEAIAHGDALSSPEVDEEVERILNPKKSAPRPDDGQPRPPGRPWINVNPGSDFTEIKSVVPVAFDRAEADRLARQVRRQAFHLRRFLEDLGLARVPERRRLQGHRFDPSRAQAMVLRNDPRVLIARRIEIRSDIFLGVVVDCSGSMATGARLDRARLFAALLAEAARGLPGVDLRVFGFTDQVIYDAGDAHQCAAHSLVSGGGNNDAAALWHVAQVARRSQRQSRLLVMISDGLPTECSVAALRTLVTHLTRRERMVCAQVAVARLAEECFPHHVRLDSDSTDEAVRRFGQMVGALVRRSLSAG